MKKTEFRTNRLYSESLKKEIVGLVETGHLTVLQATREYGIKSPESIYRWINKYSRTLKRGTRVVMEKDSVDKTNQELLKRIKDLESALGRKSMEADLYKTIVDLASKEYKTDLKKNFGDPASDKSKNKE